MAQEKAKEKSILDKFTETMKGLADSASQALKSEEPPRVDAAAAAYMPFAAEGLVTDPLAVPPLATQQPPRRKRGVTKKSAKRGTGKAAARRTNKATNKAGKKPTSKKRAHKAASRSAGARSKQAAKTAKRKGGASKAARKRSR
jgi:hypothetical protein